MPVRGEFNATSAPRISPGGRQEGSFGGGQFRWPQAGQRHRDTETNGAGQFLHALRREASADLGLRLRFHTSKFTKKKSFSEHTIMFTRLKCGTQDHA